ncbi:MAG: phosphoglycerate mutase (2,3-diphosphoglycerate-independent) [Candidatus Magasanikbacteria bacterium]|nr:phosphoglycerate mutase (2,3-diphosphoglycerate-independent) [Candidatus Magasanikbacteria bacterium]|tara:strand:- start:181 stop:1758 length:1578 start_codon:yes stop_codon:yes gene_type:complete
MPKKKKQSKKQNKPVVLAILDGFGLANPKNDGNAITPKTAPHIFSYMKKYPSAQLTAHGKAVGLFKNQEGNSEAGHFTIGAGRPIKQDLVTITEAIADGTFYKNNAFKQALFHVKKYNTAVHIMGLLTNGQSAHASPKHLYALLELCRREKIKKVYLHLFTDGRDAPPHSAMLYLKELRAHMKPNEKIATIMGRFYAMDRNKMWKRTEQTYNAIVCGKGTCTAKSAEVAIEAAYNRNETDQYICPTVITKNSTPIATVQDNDVVFFFNARSDRARQITKAFVQKDFEKKTPKGFTRCVVPKNIRFVAMTDFGPDLPGIFTAFPSPDIEHCLAAVIGKSRKQLYISETEKYAHVTYFINGGYADPVNGEKRKMIRSTGKYSYAESPEMMAEKVNEYVMQALKNNTYDFVCVNFPNADMVAHTGDFDATKIAVRVLDTQVARLVHCVQKLGGTIIITSDHGNAEKMKDLKTKEIITQHSTNLVPCIIIGSKAKKLTKKTGTLADIAPTVLRILEKDIPKEMSGCSLL